MKDPFFFNFQNAHDDFINYYQSTNKNRIDQIKLSKQNILFGASVFHKKIQLTFHNNVPKGLVICAHLKHSKLHDFYIIAASLIYGYTVFHSNWHLDGDESLVYKLKITNCRLVILDDELNSGLMLPDVKYIMISDVYTQSIYNTSLGVSTYQTVVDSIAKKKSDERLRGMLNSQASKVSEIQLDDVVMISFSEGKEKKNPKAKKVTFRELDHQFKQLESLGLWNANDVLVVFLTNPTYDWINCTVLYYCLQRPNVCIYFMQRYISTYWKILWEANEHSKNVYLPLKKSYKILNFLYPRQLEALFTLEEISAEFNVMKEGESEKEELLSSDEHNNVEQNNVVTTPVKLAKTPSKLSSMFSKKGFLNNIKSRKSGDHSAHGNVNSVLSTSPPTDNAPNSKEEPLKNRGNVYITKLHLKFLELASVLSDERVYFFLSGSHTDYKLVKMFSRIFRGKVPLVVYGCCEITPFMSLTINSNEAESYLAIAKKGYHNSHNGRPSFGYYIGNSISNSLKLRVVRSITREDPQFMVECDEGEPGFIVCNANKSQMLCNKVDDLFFNDTYLGLEDVGFYYKSDEDKMTHFFWTYSLNSSITKELSYPYDLLIGSSKLLQRSICLRYGLNPSVVRVETVQISLPGKKKRVVSVVELITVLRSDIAQELKLGFLNICKSVGLFNNFLEPEEIKIISIPWTYKGSINYPALNDMLIH